MRCQRLLSGALALPASAAAHSEPHAATGLGEQLLHLVTQHWAPILLGACIMVLLLSARHRAPCAIIERRKPWKP